MSRPGYAGRKALSIPKTATATPNNVAAEARVPTQASNDCHLETRRGRAADATDTRPSLPWEPERRALLKILALPSQADDRQEEGREEDLGGDGDDRHGEN